MQSLQFYEAEIVMKLKKKNTKDLNGFVFLQTTYFWMTSLRNFTTRCCVLHNTAS